MMIRPATISKITNFQFHIFIQFSSSLIRSLLLNLLLHFLWIKHFFVQIKFNRSKLILVFTAIVCSLCSLTFLKLFSVKLEFIHQLLILLNLLYIELVSEWNWNSSFPKLNLCLIQLLSLLICKIFIIKCFRSHIWGRNLDFFRERMSSWYLNVFLKYLINLSHLIWIQIFQTEWVLFTLVFLTFISFFNIVKWIFLFL